MSSWAGAGSECWKLCLLHDMFNSVLAFDQLWQPTCQLRWTRERPSRQSPSLKRKCFFITSLSMSDGSHMFMHSLTHIPLWWSFLEIKGSWFGDDMNIWKFVSMLKLGLSISWSTAGENIMLGVPRTHCRSVPLVVNDLRFERHWRRLPSAGTQRVMLLQII